MVIRMNLQNLLLERTGAEVVQVIGKKIILYKQNMQKLEKRRLAEKELKRKKRQQKEKQKKSSVEQSQSGQGLTA